MNKYSTVDEFLQDLSDDRKQQINALRRIILNTNPNLAEHIKWNSPSYALNGEDRLTFNMHYPDKTMLLLHMGATRKEDKKGVPVMKDESGLITWNSDIRGTLSFTTLEQIEDRHLQLEKIISRWLAVK